MPKDISNSYLSKTKQFRLIANQALKKYDISPKSLQFINFGENTTYKVTTTSNKYLLRIHCPHYHTKPALNEEIKLLLKLSKNKKYAIQKPFKNKNSKYLTTIAGLATRLKTNSTINSTTNLEINLEKSSNNSGSITNYHCDLIQWQEGRILRKSISKNHLKALSELTAWLHKYLSSAKTKNRTFWHSKGLLGSKAKLGHLNEIKNTYPSAFKQLTFVQKALTSKIKAYEKKYHNKMGLIHADFHFGNVLWNKTTPTPIDFDDFGFGFHMYDCAVSLVSAQDMLNKITKKESQLILNEYFESYNKIMPINQKDIEMVEVFKLTREIMMLCWLWNKKNNPRLQELFHKKVKQRSNYIFKEAKRLKYI